MEICIIHKEKFRENEIFQKWTRSIFSSNEYVNLIKTFSINLSIFSLQFVGLYQYSEKRSKIGNEEKTFPCKLKKLPFRDYKSLQFLAILLFYYFFLLLLCWTEGCETRFVELGEFRVDWNNKLWIITINMGISNGPCKFYYQVSYSVLGQHSLN